MINENKFYENGTLSDAATAKNFGNSMNDQAVKDEGILEHKTNELPEDSTKLQDNLRNISEVASYRQRRRSNDTIF